jgi:hypothetical protein
MRLIWTVTATALAITSLAACKQSDEQYRATARTQLLQGCQGGDASMRAQMAQAGVDVNRYCTCAIDRFMQSQSSEQLKQLSRNPGSAASDQNMQRAAEQCVREQVPTLGATPPAPQTEAAPAPANEATDAHAAEGGNAE